MSASTLLVRTGPPNCCSPNGHRSSTSPPANRTRSNLCPSCSSKISIQLFQPYIQPNRLGKQRQWNLYSPLKIFFSTTKFPLQRIIETQEPKLYILMDPKWTKALLEHIAVSKTKE
ncbi:hypothetical protein AVEN_43784-1 [Araneus ventricosus]|uniref:Uncharacterized protein n=1 Tax=Araneus ventricosus TaxID=182803 RepID=A0A4Y2STU2_ARAVE|nr:hypothetical protein AVEN_43784-1 [Araneus ventricosus]